MKETVTEGIGWLLQLLADARVGSCQSVFDYVLLPGSRSSLDLLQSAPLPCCLPKGGCFLFLCLTLRQRTAATGNQHALCAYAFTLVWSSSTLLNAERKVWPALSIRLRWSVICLLPLPRLFTVGEE